METTKRIIIVLTLVFFTAGPAISDETELSDTTTASCLLKITSNPAILPLTENIIESLLRSSGVAGKAAREVLNIKFDNEFLEVEWLAYEPEMIGQNPYQEETQISEENDEAPMTHTLFDLPPRSPRRPSTVITSEPSNNEQMIFLKITVDIESFGIPAAEEFASALIENLRNVLSEIANDHLRLLKIQLERVNENRDEARTQLAKVMDQIKATGSIPEIEQDPETEAVYRLLEETVDLSDLTPGKSFGELLDRLEKSTEPPLEIQPNWRDLDENADIDQTTAAGLDPMTGIKIKRVLKLLLKGLSNTMAELDFVVKDGVIMIATKDALPSNMITHVYDIPAPAYSAYNAETLIHTIQETIEPESWVEQSDIGEGTISNIGNKLVVFQTTEVHRKILQFLQTVTADIPVILREDTPTDMLLDEKRQLIREKRIMEIEIAKLEARNNAIGEQIAKISTQMSSKMEKDHVTDELKHLLDIQTQQLENIKESVERGQSGNIPLTVAEEKIIKTSIELAQRAEELRKSVGGDQLDRFNNELADITIELAEKRAELNVISNQLGQTENQLSAIYDPQISQIRLATRIFQKAENRFNELNTRIADFQLPTVTVLGVN